MKKTVTKIKKIWNVFYQYCHPKCNDNNRIASEISICVCIACTKKIVHLYLAKCPEFSLLLHKCQTSIGDV
jgi:hypothetical protein